VIDIHPTVTTLSADWAERVGQGPDFRRVRWRQAGEVQDWSGMRHQPSSGPR